MVNGSVGDGRSCIGWVMGGAAWEGAKWVGDGRGCMMAMGD